MERFYPITVHNGCRGYNRGIRNRRYNVGNQLSVEWQRPVTIFYFLRFEASLFVASYNSQGDGGGFRHRLHTGWEADSLSVGLLSSLVGRSRNHLLQQ
jgi:hypothetical protein